MFEHGKVYKFNPSKTVTFKSSVRDNNLEYNDIDLWQLEVKKSVFMYKGKISKKDLIIDGYLIKRNWCEEVKWHRIASFMAKLRKMFIRIWLGGGIKSMSVPIPVHKIKGRLKLNLMNPLILGVLAVNALTVYLVYFVIKLYYKR